MIRYLKNKSRTLSAANEFHSGTAIFSLRDGIWSCTHADPPLKFLLALDPIAAKFDLIRRGYSFSWISSDGPQKPTPSNSAVREQPSGSNDPQRSHDPWTTEPAPASATRRLALANAADANSPPQDHRAPN